MPLYRRRSSLPDPRRHPVYVPPLHRTENRGSAAMSATGFQWMRRKTVAAEQGGADPSKQIATQPEALRWTVADETVETVLKNTDRSEPKGMEGEISDPEGVDPAPGYWPADDEGGEDSSKSKRARSAFRPAPAFEPDPNDGGFDSSKQEGAYSPAPGFADLVAEGGVTAEPAQIVGDPAKRAEHEPEDTDEGERLAKASRDEQGEDATSPSPAPQGGNQEVPEAKPEGNEQPTAPAQESEPERPVSQMTKAELIVHARQAHGLDLDESMKRDQMLAQIRQAENG